VHTLASKLKLGTAKKTFAKFGKNLEIRDGKGRILASFPKVPLAKPKKKVSNDSYCITEIYPKT
jgi:Type II intron maturase